MGGIPKAAKGLTGGTPGAWAACGGAWGAGAGAGAGAAAGAGSGADEPSADLPRTSRIVWPSWIAAHAGGECGA